MFVRLGVLASVMLLAPINRTVRERAADPATALAVSQGINTMIGGLNQMVQDAIREGDKALAARLADAELRLRGLLPALDSASKGLLKNVNAATDNASREAMGVLSALGDESAEAGTFANAALNEKLADFSRLLNVFTNVPPVLLAVSPSVINAGATPREIRLTGFLPGKPNRDVKVWLNGAPVQVTRTARHALSLPLPAALVRPGSEVAIRVDAREYWGLFDLFWSTHTFEERVRVGSPDCFSCTLRRLGPNPDYRERITASSAYVIDANTQGANDNPFRNETVTAASLFTATMGPAANDFVLTTVSVESIVETWAGYGADRCGQGPSWSRMPASGFAAPITYSVSAPRKDRRTRRLHVCDRGGTHSVLSLVPTFLVARKTSQPVASVAPDSTIRFGLAGTSLPHKAGAGEAFAYHLECVYAEHGERWPTGRAVVSETDQSSVVRRLMVRVAQDRLVIQPLIPSFSGM